uniref:TLDc domain-containing protein n=1 Tax=Rhizophagus irregularis (strain DAOM 181602 / DAOM 197198 / MUCL 43194) TaxID=747089 RepID=U9UMF4_RHIID
MKEIEVWEHVLKWGLAQNPTLLPDPNTWSDDDFKKMENTLQHCLSLIRFFSLSSKDFLQSVRPYKKLLKRQLYEDLLNSHLDPDSEPTNNISLPRNIKNDTIINSKIVNNLNIILTISRQIDKLDIKNNFARLKEPYNFRLLLRGSRDGFTPKKFHELCDDIPHTVTFIKVKGKDEILGGYNPIIWKSFGGCGKTMDSFIFSFKNDNVEDGIISYVKHTDYAIRYNFSIGPFFGYDIITCARNGSEVFNDIRYSKNYYEKKMRYRRSIFYGRF